MSLVRAIHYISPVFLNPLLSSSCNYFKLGLRMYSSIILNDKNLSLKFHILNRSRSIIECRGPDAKKLLQGLITNDMNCLENHIHESQNKSLSTEPHCCSVIYAFFLNTNVRN